MQVNNKVTLQILTYMSERWVTTNNQRKKIKSTKMRYLRKKVHEIKGQTMKHNVLGNMKVKPIIPI